MTTTLPGSSKNASSSRRWLVLAARAATVAGFGLYDLGCGGDDAPVDAAGECKATVATFASKLADCAVQTGEIDASLRDQYISKFKTEAEKSCWNVTKILGNPDLCATEYNVLPCTSYSPTNGLPPPQSCLKIYGTN